jgi:hypothetical protein
MSKPIITFFPFLAYMSVLVMVGEVTGHQMASAPVITWHDGVLMGQEKGSLL